MMPLDDWTDAELCVFWQSLPARVQWPIREPDPVALGALRLRYHGLGLRVVEGPPTRRMSWDTDTEMWV